MERLPPMAIEVIQLALLAVVTIVSYRWILGKWQALRLRIRFKRGAQGETNALKYLKKKGFKINGGQQNLNSSFLVDGKEVPFNIRADFLVTHKGRKGVVEVKTGNTAPNPASSATRRQILEYSWYYDVDDVYLFDAEKNRLHHINFGLPGRVRKNLRGYFKGLVTGVGLATASVMVIHIFGVLK